MFFRNFQSTVKEQLLPSAMQNQFQKDFSSTKKMGVSTHLVKWNTTPLFIILIM